MLSHLFSTLAIGIGGMQLPVGASEVKAVSLELLLPRVNLGFWSSIKIWGESCLEFLPLGSWEFNVEPLLEIIESALNSISQYSK